MYIFKKHTKNVNIDIINLFLSSNRKIDFKNKTIKQVLTYSSGITGFDILRSNDIKFDQIKDKISKNEKLLFSLKYLLKINTKYINKLKI